MNKIVKGIIGVIASSIIIAAMAIPRAEDSKIVNDISNYNNRLSSIIEATKWLFIQVVITITLIPKKLYDNKYKGGFNEHSTGRDLLLGHTASTERSYCGAGADRDSKAQCGKA